MNGLPARAASRWRLAAPEVLDLTTKYGVEAAVGALLQFRRGALH